MRWTAEKIEEIRGLWAGGLKKRQIRETMGLTDGQYQGARMRYNLHAKSGRPLTLADDHPAVVEGRSLFKTENRVRLPVLKPGGHSPKLGRTVTKGAWKGMPIYSLTLEERATCPQLCVHWRDCFGNRMRWAARQPQGHKLESHIAKELEELSRKHPNGFVLRLHILGDFVSVNYAARWSRWMWQFPALRVFGYTAHSPYSPIGKVIAALNKHNPDRWQVRFSEGPPGSFRTGDDGIVCPAQTGKTRSCATCSLCWSTLKPIRFLAH